MWKPWDVAALIRSIFEDYYIGTPLFWKASEENMKLLSCEKIYGFTGNAEPEHIVLDGQQRLSALYYAFFSPDKIFPNRKSKALFFVNTQEYLAENYDDAFYYEWLSKRINKLGGDREQQFQQHILPLNIFGKDTHAWVYWAKDYEQYWKNDPQEAGKAAKFHKILKDLINNYEISFIELNRNIDVAKVCDIFTRINNTGEDLSIFDLMNAMLRPKEIKLKQMWREVEDDLAITKKSRMRTAVLQTMSLLKQGYCSPKYIYYLVPEATKQIKKENGTQEEIVLIDSQEEFLDLWEFSINKIKETIAMITNAREFGAIRPKYIPYTTMLPIVTALNVELEKDKYPDKNDVKQKIQRWYWSSIFTKNYSSAVESQMAMDYSHLQEWFTDDKALPKIVKQAIPEVENLALNSEDNPNSAIYKAIFNLIVRNGARDWNSLQLPEYTKLNDHHIVPKSWGKKNNVKNIDSILNRTPISDKTNKTVISDKMPNEYIKEMLNNAKNKQEIYKLFESHLISPKAIKILLREDFSEGDFQEFIQERGKLIKKEIKTILRIADQETLRLK